MTVTTIIFAYWGAKLAGALVALTLWLAKLVDWRRHNRVPVQLTSRAYRGAGAPGEIFSAERPAPMMAGKSQEKVARYADVAEHIKTGDVLTFSGRTIWSYLLRIATFSDKSHAGMIVRDDEGVWVVDSCEGRNFTKRLLVNEVKQFPGQWYWHAIRHEFNHNFHRLRAADYFLSRIANQTKYGWAGIVLKFFTLTPGLRELAYLTRLDRLPFYKNRPFCSQAVKDAMHAGSLDPVPGRDGQLVVPQEINQSLAIYEGVALVT